MHRRYRLLFLVIGCLVSFVPSPVFAGANEPDSVYLISYTNSRDFGRTGLRFAWSADKQDQDWHLIENGAAYLKCDYGSQKYIFDPYLYLDKNEDWVVIWGLNDTVNQFAAVRSPDLVTWKTQYYPFLKAGQAFHRPVVSYNEETKRYDICFTSHQGYFKTSTKDFKSFAPAERIPASAYRDDRKSIQLPSGEQQCNICKVSWKVVGRLEKAGQLKRLYSQSIQESPDKDGTKYAGLSPLTATVTLHPAASKQITDMLTGVFFEDINYAADGGLYAEMIQNRDFEYAPVEKLYKDSSWNAKHSWTFTGAGSAFKIDSTAPLNKNNPHYAALDVAQSGAVLANSGYDGIALKKADRYTLSFFTRIAGANKPSRRVSVQLVAKDGRLIAKSDFKIKSGSWMQYKATLTAPADASDATLELGVLDPGQIDFDMISLFPVKTYKNRSNGLRADLAEAVAEIHPKFVRFPGGCLVHGDGIGNIYRWKNTIGPLQSRKPQPNIWRYHQSLGLGYFEYFQFCEDIGAAPVPVIAAGVPCQNSGLLTGEMGQHGGIPMAEMQDYIEDIMDLIQWANGPADSKWGKLRAAAGHPAPFHLKYIGIGNEDLISAEFEQRFTMIFNAIKQRHPEITVIGTSGPFHEGADYNEGWALASKLHVPMVDEHYYEQPGWFINNQHFYDNYDRSKPKVYLGEYASRGNTLFNALAEALYMIGLERNGDVVHMASYAPLLAREGHTQWRPDLIYFNNTEVKTTINYDVQRLFGQNAGDTYIPNHLTLSAGSSDLSNRIGVSVLRRSADSSIIIKVVNMLPVRTTLKLDLNALMPDCVGEKYELSGNPESKNAPLKVEAASAQNILAAQLAPYSLTVWRLHQ